MSRFKWLFVSLAFMSHLYAWEGHYILTFKSFHDWPSLDKRPNIMPESLENFVHAEQKNLESLLKDYETWALKHIQSYPPLPLSLVFDEKVSLKQNMVQKFLLSIRVNPELSYTNFLLYPVGVAHRIKHSFSSKELLLKPLPSLLKLRAATVVVEKILPEEQVSALEILTAAAEEPDHGLDLNLWDDNKSWFGPLMGLGAQPFGNPVLTYASQAPLHMGFYNEALLMYWAAPWLKRCYPEYRITLFLALSRHALASGHTYWGYRFLGWAIHYIQDLTQPYHAKLAPGTWWPKLIVLNLMELIGNKTPANNMRQLLTNRHLALENYQFESMRENEALDLALTETAHDQKYPAFDDSYFKIVAKEAYLKADDIDALLVKVMPKLYVDDPSYLFSGTDPKINLLTEAKKSPSLNEFNELFLTFMRAFGSHSRNTVSHILAR